MKCDKWSSDANRIGESYLCRMWIQQSAGAENSDERRSTPH